ncbi:helicase-associated domain-containing protein [Sanguibacter suaedae]|uniref:Helicase-associated domain-containing protein n=1 Tax=Sanguibacter suaedae TaxID=2795737 RepID=A0A934MD76_9MICO|nr:helicase-associated domain-containing protein [Sanguibacter suaedae]MBI9114554.1 helicase-associated domain-containing protein [Sanguibacter suaedae]
MATFSDWVRARSDEQLVALLDHRPDLASPSPATLLSLAARATSRASLHRAASTLDAAHLVVLESVAVLGGAGTTVTADRLVEATAPDDPAPGHAADVLAVLADLESLALVWSPDGTALRVAPGVDEIQDAYPAGLGPPDRSPERPATAPQEDGPVDADDVEDVLGALDDAPPGARSILAALMWGPPVGRVPSTAGSPTAVPTRWLVRHGLVRHADAQHILLPRHVGLALRGGRTHRGLPRPPEPPAEQRARPTVDAEAVRSAQEVVRFVTEVLLDWQEVPPHALKAGGLGVRELRRLAQRLETDQTTTAFVVELAAMAGLVADDGDDPASYSPTLDADDWLEADVAQRWAALASAWLPSARAPWLVGSRDDKGVLRNALDPELHRSWAPRLRGEVLGVLRSAPLAPLSAHDVLAVLRWRTPRSVPPVETLAAILHEAHLLGLTGAGALAPTGDVLADVPAQTVPDAGAVTALGERLDALLPEAVDDLLLQGDLTGVVPGRPSPTLEALVAESADVESRGAALTVRFSPASVTRALDAGRTGEELLAELAAHSPTPVPQPLEYLVRDAARRHGQVRVGAAASYVRVEDPALLAGIVDDPRLHALGMFRVAPTVLVAAAPIGQVLAALRERGVAPAMEGPDGQIVHADRRTPRVRVTGRRARRLVHAARPVAAVPPEVRRERLAGLVADLRRSTPPDRPVPDPGAEDVGGTPDQGTAADRSTGPRAGRSGDHVGAHGAGTTEPVVALGMLREAAADGREVWLEMVGAHGVPQRRRVRPLRVDAGRLRAVDVARESELTVAVHRIVAVEHIAPEGPAAPPEVSGSVPPADPPHDPKEPPHA